MRRFAADEAALTMTGQPSEEIRERTKVLVAEDDAVSRRVMQASLEQWGYEPVVVEDGDAAWKILSEPDPPAIAVLDWMMPGVDGPTLCQRVRDSRPARPAYLILLTARGDREDLLAGLGSGADDYVTKPFDRAELRARLEVGVRILALQTELASRVREVEQALTQVKQLKGLLPICMYCKKIRDDRNYWQQVESYISRHSEAEFTHGICPDCYHKLVEAKKE
jgi:sigma-B regulation protein RsbU (phosphoserine phosphatase)